MKKENSQQRVSKNISADNFNLSEKIDLIKIDKEGIILSKDVIQTKDVKEFIKLLKEILSVPPITHYQHYWEEKINKLAGDKLR